MRWSFNIREVSNNCYEASATRESGENISMQGTDSIVSALLQASYKFELDKDTFHGYAAYLITSSFLIDWSAIYHEGMFGSWTVGNRGNLPRIDYDGRDFYLMVSETTDRYSWQGHIDQLSKGRCPYFSKLAFLKEIQG